MRNMDKMKTYLDSIIWWCGTLLITCAAVCLIPVMFVLMLLDFKRLKRSALAVEPLVDDDMPPEAYSLFNRFVRKFIAPIVIVVTLPIVVIVGLFQIIFTRNPTDDDIIW